MKKKFLAVLCLFFIFLCFCAFLKLNLVNFFKKDSFTKVQKPNIQNSKSYKILKIVEADKFYVDLNNNNKIDSDELFKIAGINAFSPNKNYFGEQNAKKLGLSLEEFLINGFITRKWAQDNLLNKYVKIYPKNKLRIGANYRCAQIIFENNDLAKLLLKNGLAYLDKTYSEVQYLQFENLAQTKLNVSKFNIDDFLILNKKSNIAHKIYCDFARDISNGELILISSLNNKKIKPCKICSKNSKISVFKVENDDSDFVFRGFDYYNIPKSKNIYKTSPHKKFENDIELFLISPLLKSRPDNSCSTDICKEIVLSINNTKTSIDIALYGVGNQTEIINALENARSRGVKIRAVIDNSSNSGYVYHLSEDFINKFDAKVNPLKSLMHNKFFIFDDKKVITGSANISATGTGGYNANAVVVVNSAELALAYTKEFEQMFLKNKFSKNKDKISSQKIKLSNTTLTPYFSPKDNIFENAIKPLIKNAKSEIFVSAFYLTDKNLISELIDAKNRGVRVLCLVDALGAMNSSEKIKMLRKNDIAVIVENWGGKNHEKTILVDSKYLLIGSSNFSKSGFEKNNENVIVIESPAIALFYRDYYLYLYNSIDEKYLNYFVRAESKDSKNSCSDGIDNDFDGKIDAEDEGCI